MSSFSLVIMISGNGSNLQAIIDAINDGLPATIKAVISDNPNAYGLQRAQRTNIPTVVIDRNQFSTRNEFDQVIFKQLVDLNPNLIVLAGFMRILPGYIVQKFPNKIINIHPSLLPKHRGLNTHQRVLDAKDSEHGVTVHIVTESLDDGPILAQKRIAVTESDTPESLKEKVHQLEHQLYPEVIRSLIEETTRIR